MNPTKQATLLIGGREINYKIRRSGRAKYLQLRISNAGILELILPSRAALTDGERFINEKKEWVNKHLHLLNKKKEEEQFLYLGKPLIIKQEFHLFDNKYSFKEKDNVLTITSPHNSAIPIKDLYQFFLRMRAKRLLPAWTRELSVKHNFNPKRITIKGQKTRWGSCSGKGNLNYNFKLMRFDKEIIEYVIIHELCHLRQMNHSKLFWDEVAKYSPRYRILREKLKRATML